MLNSKVFESDVKPAAVRDGWGDGLAQLGKINSGVVVLTADVKESTRVEKFARAFPERFIECGVAEQNMMGIAAGLAAAGKIPFVSSYAVFSPGRSWDQLRVCVCYSNLHVVVGGHHTGVAVGPDGATHQALEDIAITRVLPNITVIVPADYEEAKKAVFAAASDTNGPVYIRLAREKTPPVSNQNSIFNIQKAEVIWDSSKITNFQFSIFDQGSISKLSNIENKALIIGVGPILSEALLAAKELHEEGIGVTVVNNHTVKPLDKETIIKAAEKCGAVVTAEDHQIAGGMGSAVAEVLSAQYPVPMEFVGVRDSFGESGTPEELAQIYGLKAKNIVHAVKKVMERKE
jgi:transketolase